MGYSGPPSKACLACRQRRIKCDRALPACGQCCRTARVCEGYRVHIDFFFRDETSTVAEKAKGRKPQSPPATHTTDTHVALRRSVNPGTQVAATPKFPESSSEPVGLTQCPLLRSLSAPNEGQAVCFFFTTYGSGNASEKPRSFFEYLPSLYSVESDNHLLQCIIPAIGLGGLAHRRNEPGLLQAADAAYSSALRRTNHALRDPLTARSDQTLISVLLLGLYETDISCRPRSTIYWLKHVQGACALLELRGKEQLQTEIGRRLFRDLRTQIGSRCSLTRSPIPHTVIELSRECRVYSFDAADGLVLIDNDFCQLRSERPFHPQVSDSEAVDRDIIDRCATLAEQLEDWRLQLAPDSFPLRYNIKTPKANVLGKYYDVYTDPWIAGLMSHYHRLHLLVHERAIVRLLNLESRCLLSQDEGVKLRSLRSSIAAHVDELCASVPHLLASGRIEAGKSLLWPLFVAGQIFPRTTVLHDGTTHWIIAQLRTIASDMGVRQAVFLVQTLLSQQEVTELLVEAQHDHDRGVTWSDTSTA